MKTQEVLDSLNTTLIAEGVPEEERQVRIQILKESIEVGERLSAELKAKKPTSKPGRRMPLGKAIELSIFTLVIGWFAGIFTLHYYQTNP